MGAGLPLMILLGMRHILRLRLCLAFVLSLLPWLLYAAFLPSLTCGVRCLVLSGRPGPQATAHASSSGVLLAFVVCSLCFPLRAPCLLQRALSLLLWDRNGPTIRPFDVLLPKHTRITEVSHSLIQAIDWTL